MAPVEQDENSYGLGDPLMLQIIDKLFGCGAGELVNLPQIIVIGDQSSGKSSVLEGLIRKSLPRDSGLCTRFATQIIFRRSSEERISVSIIADRNATPDHRNRVETWGRTDITALDSGTFTGIMSEVHDVMGVSQVGDDSGQKRTFSNDILRLEIAGPDQEHLTVIDVPGIFKNTTPGLTTKADIELVKNMVLGYMENPRSVMLAVIPANVDVATQEILELATDVDPMGDRTLGVLTKPDLVDQGAESRVIDLIEGRTRVMKLGWHVVRNPGQQQILDGSLDRHSLEMDFFRTKAPWKHVQADKFGIESLRDRLKEILSVLVRQEFPKVKHEISKKLANKHDQVKRLGPERSTPSAQAAYLTELATEYQRLVSLSLDAKFGSDERFERSLALRLAPTIMARFVTFEKEMAWGGHEYSFRPGRNGSSPHSDAGSVDVEDRPPYVASSQRQFNDFQVRKEEDAEDLVDILQPQETLSVPDGKDIEQWLHQVYETSRGFELGTFDSSILATTMKKQSCKWVSLSLGYISDIIVIVHRFITTTLDLLCYDDTMKQSLFNTLADGLSNRYQTAIKQVSFLLEVERNGLPMTLNHYFNDNLEKCRQERMVSMMQAFAIDDCTHGSVIRLSDAGRTHPMSNTEHVVQDIHDILQSYYKVARKRYVDNVVKQATAYFLIAGPETPLNLFSPMFVSGLPYEELEHVAGEAPRTRRERARLNRDIASLTEAKSILSRGR